MLSKEEVDSQVLGHLLWTSAPYTLYRHLTVSPVAGQAATLWRDGRMETEQATVTAHDQTVTSCCDVLLKLLNLQVGGGVVQMWDERS
jgi:hypothetical protein